VSLFGRVLCSAVVVAAIASCAARPNVQSQRDPNFDSELRRLFVLVDLKTEPKGGFLNDFSAEFAAVASRCAIEARVDFVSPTELEPRIHLARMRDFGGDSSLLVDVVGSTRTTTTGGGVTTSSVSRTYDVKLIAGDGPRTVWHARLELEASKARQLATLLGDQLIQDRVLRHCTVNSPALAPAPMSRTLAGDPDIIVMPRSGEQTPTTTLAGVKPMTFDELRDCGAKIKNIHEIQAVLKADERSFRRRKIELEQRGKAIEAARATVNAKSKPAVDEFNARIVQHQNDIATFNRQLTTHVKEVGDSQQLNNEFNAGCANRAYRNSDLNRLPSEILAAIRDTSKASDIPLVEEPPSPPVSADPKDMAGPH
jgi:hypothetical protein